MCVLIIKNIALERIHHDVGPIRIIIIWAAKKANRKSRDKWWYCWNIVMVWWNSIVNLWDKYALCVCSVIFNVARFSFKLNKVVMMWYWKVFLLSLSRSFVVILVKNLLSPYIYFSATNGDKMRPKEIQKTLPKSQLMEKKKTDQSINVYSMLCTVWCMTLS